MQIRSPEGEDLMLKKLQAGDEQAFAAIYNHYYPLILDRVLHLMHSPELAKDITQEIFMKIWENREKLGEIQSFKSYLFITARNHSLNVLKSVSRSRAALGEIVRHLDQYRNTTEEQVHENEYTRFINEKLKELPPRAKEIFALCREQQKSYNEVAAELGISRDAVKSRMVHVMKILRDSVGRQIGLSVASLAICMGHLPYLHHLLSLLANP